MLEVRKYDEMVKFIVTLWSHNTYNTLIRTSFDYRVEQNVKEVSVIFILWCSNYFFSLISRCNPNLEPIVLCILGVWFTWDLKGYGRHIHVIASLYLKVRYIPLTKDIVSRPRLVGHLKHHQSNKLNKFVKSD